MKYFCVAFGLFLAWSRSAPASDWPQWRGPYRTGAVPASEPVPTNLSSEPAIVWRIPVGEGLASPVVAGDKTVYFDNVDNLETLHAADLRDGHELWHTAIGPTFSDSQGPTGPRCTPTIDDPRVYAQTCRGEFQCLDLKTGHLLWRTNFSDFGAVFIGEKGNAAGGSRHGNNGAPLVDGDQVFVMVGSTNGATLACFNKETGRLVWKSQNDQSGYAAPVMATILGKKQVVAFVADALLALDPADGALLWKLALKTSLGRHVTTPVVIDDMVVVGSFQLGLLGVKVRRDGPEFHAEQAWVNKKAAMNFSSPVAMGNYIYGLGPSKDLVCLDARDGHLVWRREGCVSSSADKAHAAFMVMNRNILMLNDSGELILFEANPEAFKEVSRLQVCGFNWCNPAYADGRLYLREIKKTLYCIDLMKGLNQ